MSTHPLNPKDLKFCIPALNYAPGPETDCGGTIIFASAAGATIVSQLVTGGLRYQAEFE